MGPEESLKPSRIHLWILLLAATILVGCRQRPDPPAGPLPELRPVLLVGMDGIEWDVVLPMLHQGRLPTLARLMEHGSWGELKTLEPTLSPAIWTTIATGVAPKTHGIERFLEGTGDERRLFTSQDRQVKAVWNMLDDHQLRSATVGWWATWPVEPVNGVMVAQVNLPAGRMHGAGPGVLKGVVFEGLDEQVYPPDRREEVFAIVRQASDGMESLDRQVFGERPEVDPASVPGQLWEASRWSIRADAIYRAVTLHLLSTADDPYQLTSVYFGGPDVLGHRFWRYLEPEAFHHPPSPDEVAAFGGVIPDYYAWMDVVLGELIAASPPDTTVFVVSDHGMRATHRRRFFNPDKPIFKLDSGGHPHGIPAFFVASGPHIRPTGHLPTTREEVARVGSVYDLLPTLCALLGLPLGRDFKGEVLDEVVDPAFLQARPPGKVRSHTPAEWAVSRPTIRPPQHYEAQRMEQLRALGYIE